MDEQIEIILRAGHRDDDPGYVGTFYVCGLCGVMVFDADRHDEWHERQLAAAVTLLGFLARLR